MDEKEEIKLKPINDEFGSGPYINWEDGDTKIVVITDWGQYEKKTNDGEKIAFRCSVLKVNDREYVQGEKVIDTTSINFMKSLKPFLINAQEKGTKALRLDISRKGKSKETTYFIKDLSDSAAEVELEKVEDLSTI